MTMVQPEVTVVLPFRDAAATLPEALASLRAQTFGRFECLLIDHASTDASSAIARQVGRHDARFRILRACGTFEAALNAGIAAAAAPLVARMDADDRAHPERLARQVERLAADPRLSLVSCRVACFPRHHLRDGMRRYEAWLNRLCEPEAIRAALFVESPLPHPTVCVRRAALRAVGGYRATGDPEDYDLWMRLLLGGHRAAKLPEVLLEWRDWPGRLTRTHPRYHTQRIFALKLRHLPRVVAPGTPVQIWGAGPIGRRWAKALRVRGYPVRRFIDIDPRKLGRTAGGGVPIEPPERLERDAGFVLAAVGSPGARERIEAHLRARGLEPWDHYLAVA
jgi:glycosyltransferase involved in cell wall biosynthesis